MGPKCPTPRICYNTFQPSQRQLYRQLPPKLQELRSEMNASGRTNTRPTACTTCDPKADLHSDSFMHTALPYTHYMAAVRAQALLTHPDIVCTGLNPAQEKSWHESGRVRPKGLTPCIILESVRSTRKEDCRLHVSRDRTTAMRCAHGQGKASNEAL